jgi:TIGR03009 family protein
MRYCWLALSGGLIATTLLLAQQPPAPPGAPVLNPKDPLDAVLMNYEYKVKQIETLSAQCFRKKIDKIYGPEEYEGEFRYMKPNRASMELKKKNNPQFYEKYICTGSYVYEFLPSDKKMRIWTLPKSAQGDNLILSYLFPTRAIDAKARYQLTLVPAPAEQAKWYYFIKVMPILKEDKANFMEGRVVLRTGTFMPVQFWFKDLNSNEITYEFKELKNPDPKVKATDFAPPALPKDWKQEVVNPQAQPNVFKPGQK